MMDLSALGWREGVIAAAALIGLYASFIIIRLSRLSSKQPPLPWKQDPAVFGEQIFRDGVDAELAELRGQIDALRSDVEKLKSARNVSPQYGEAVTLAQQGLDVHTIAERCGISIGEAELVRALSQKAE